MLNPDVAAGAQATRDAVYGLGLGHLAVGDMYGRHVCRHVYDVCMDMRMDMRMDMCMDVCMNMSVDMCVDMRVWTCG